MKEEQENRELNQASTGVTPPPFRQSEQTQDATVPNQAASPTLSDRTAALGLDENQTQQLSQLIGDMNPELITDEVLATLARGITHDTDVENADATGYLRGRNEKIEAMLHPEPQDEETQATPVFPRYCRRSIWELDSDNRY